MARFLHICARELGGGGGFALLGALGVRVVGVSEAHVVQNPHVMLPLPRKFLFLCSVTPFREHYTHSELVQCSLNGAMLPNRCSALRMEVGAVTTVPQMCLLAGVSG